MEIRQTICTLCEVNYSYDCSYGFNRCKKCAKFFLSLGRIKQISILPATIEKIRKFVSSGYLDVFRDNTLSNSPICDQITNILNNEKEREIQKFERASEYIKNKKKLFLDLLNDIKCSKDNKEIDALLGIYLLMQTSNRPGYNDQNVAGIFSLKFENIQLKVSDGDFLIKLDYLGKSGVFLAKEYKIDQIVYQKLEKLSQMKSSEYLFAIHNYNKSHYLENLFDKYMLGLNGYVIRCGNANEFFLSLLKGINNT